MMSSALLRSELKSELEALDQRYGGRVGEKSSKKRLSKQRYRPNSTVEELNKAFKTSQESAESQKKEKIRANVEKLLKLSEASSLNRLPTDPILQQIESSKRYYEPKGRNLLKPPAKKSKPAQETTAFSDQDFEKFSQEYFAHSEPIAKPKGKKKKTAAHSDFGEDE